MNKSPLEQHLVYGSCCWITYGINTADTQNYPFFTVSDHVGLNSLYFFLFRTAAMLYCTLCRTTHILPCGPLRNSVDLVKVDIK